MVLAIAAARDGPDGADGQGRGASDRHLPAHVRPDDPGLDGDKFTAFFVVSEGTATIATRPAFSRYFTMRVATARTITASGRSSRSTNRYVIFGFTETIRRRFAGPSEKSPAFSRSFAPPGNRPGVRGLA